MKTEVLYYNNKKIGHKNVNISHIKKHLHITSIGQQVIIYITMWEYQQRILKEKNDLNESKQIAVTMYIFKLTAI